MSTAPQMTQKRQESRTPWAAREVSASLDAEVTGFSEIELQIAVANQPGLSVDESLEVTVGGSPVAVEELASSVGGRIHRFTARDAPVSVRYRARIEGAAPVAEEQPLDRSLYLRPSRYADSDRLFGFVASRFDIGGEAADVIRAVAEYVSGHLSYEPGASGPTDGASDSLLAGAGVCRDYSHLTVALLRAAHIPARLVAVYAPGCDPMDFHAVTEVLVDGRWLVLDTTGLAPRQSLVRIATGRDAADTAFMDNHGGGLALNFSQVTAVVDGELPIDDTVQPESIR